MRRPTTLLAIAIVTVAWVTAVFAAPLAACTTASGASALVYAVGSLICHQRPERSFHLAGSQLPVCARCVGLYAGAAVGAIAWVVAAGLGRQASPRSARLRQLRTVRTLIVIAALPTAVSASTALAGWWDPGNALRAALALPLGLAIGACVSAVAARDLE
jgi:uncharacterized membrane protein